MFSHEDLLSNNETTPNLSNFLPRLTLNSDEAGSATTSLNFSENQQKAIHISNCLQNYDYPLRTYRSFSTGIKDTERFIILMPTDKSWVVGRRRQLPVLVIGEMVRRDFEEFGLQSLEKAEEKTSCH